MAGFEGKWKLETSENFDEYMKALGVSYLVRKMGAAAKPVMTVSYAGDSDLWTVKSESSVKTSEFTFKFNQEFDETTADGRKVKSSMVKDSDTKWTQVQKGDPPSTITRELTDPNTLVAICVAKDVSSKRVYKRAQ